MVGEIFALYFENRGYETHKKYDGQNKDILNSPSKCRVLRGSHLLRGRVVTLPMFRATHCLGLQMSQPNSGIISKKTWSFRSRFERGINTLSP